MIKVPTKTEDGGSNKSSETIDSSGHDAFLLYSDDNVRMMEILGLHASSRGGRDQAAGIDAQQGHGGVGENQQEQNPIERRTHISFEVHDAVFRQMHAYFDNVRAE